MTEALAVSALLALALALGWGLVRAGRAAQRGDDSEGRLDDIDKANKARDALRHDAGFARRVRDRFTR